MTTTADSGPGSLRDAIAAINADTSHTLYASPSNPSVDEIDFDITAASDTGGGFNAPTGMATITPQTPLPTIVNSVIINGFSQPGPSPNQDASPNQNPITLPTSLPDNAMRLITLDGTQAGNADGLVIAGGNSTVEGLEIEGFGVAAPTLVSSIHLETYGNDTISGCYIYTTNQTITSNNNAGIFVDNVANNTIGGVTPAARNVLGGSLEAIRIHGPQASGNLVQGNFVGTDGAKPLVSQDWATAGVSIHDAPSNTITGNDIWCGVNAGIIIAGDTTPSTAAYNTVQGNYIGTNSTGESEFFNSLNNIPDGPYNGFVGVLLYGDATDNLIGGSSTADCNVISGWDGEAIDMEPIGAGYVAFDDGGYNVSNFDAPPSGNVVEDNYIGCDASGSHTLALSTNGTGVVIWGTNNEVLNNVISGNGKVGVSISNGAEGTTVGGASDYGQYVISGNTVQGNLIGVTAAGKAALGNNVDGVFVGVLPDYGDVSVADNLIGGTTPGAANIIAFNGGDGVQVGSSSSDAGTTGNTIRGNSIYSNTTLGIDLAGDGVTLNDSQGHVGPNNLQNFPLITSAVSSSTDTSVNGTFSESAQPNTEITLDFYANPAAADPSGNGQGETWLGSTTVTTDMNGNVAFTADLATAALGSLAGQWITATATDPNGNTSEFSADLPILAAGATTTLQLNDNADFQTAISEINALTGDWNNATVIIDLAPGEYSDTTVQPPSGMTLEINGTTYPGGETTEFVGHSPALTVLSGNVVVTNITFTTATSSPTVVIAGGNLTMTGDSIQSTGAAQTVVSETAGSLTLQDDTVQSTGAAVTAVSVSGGTANLGTPTSPGGNTLERRRGQRGDPHSERPAREPSRPAGTRPKRPEARFPRWTFRSRARPFRRSTDDRLRSPQRWPALTARGQFSSSSMAATSACRFHSMATARRWRRRNCPRGVTQLLRCVRAAARRLRSAP